MLAAGVAHADPVNLLTHRPAIVNVGSTVAMGTKKDWREICISELEIWGTSVTPTVNTVPPVYVNSFEPPPPLTEDDCTRLLAPANVSTSVYVLSDRYGLCEMVDTTNPHDPFDLMRHTLTLVALPRKQALPQTVEIDSQINEGLGGATDTRLRIDMLSVGDESLVIAALGSSTWNNLPDADPSALPRPSTKFTLYRATSTGLAQVLEVDGNEGCAFAESVLPLKNGKSRSLLDYTCGKTTKHFGFNGTRYVQR